MQPCALGRKWAQPSAHMQNNKISKWSGWAGNSITSQSLSPLCLFPVRWFEIFIFWLGLVWSWGDRSYVNWTKENEKCPEVKWNFKPCSLFTYSVKNFVLRAFFFFFCFFHVHWKVFNLRRKFCMIKSSLKQKYARRTKFFTLRLNSCQSWIQ